jgi:putative ABC transport system permease protein
VVSETLARLHFPGEDPIGRTIRITDPAAVEIVGVVADVHSQQWQAPADPELYVPHAQVGTRAMTFVVKSARPTADVLAAAREVVRAEDARLPLVFPGSLRALEESALARPRFYLWLLGLFAVLAAALAGIGLYGVVAYAVAQRTREIGVRMALGAGRPAVVTHMLWQGLLPAFGGIAAGLMASAGATRVIASLLFGVTPTDPATFVAVAAGLAVVAAVACAIPALRASRVSPTEALRSE